MPKSAIPIEAFKQRVAALSAKTKIPVLTLAKLLLEHRQATPQINQSLYPEYQDLMYELRENPALQDAFLRDAKSQGLEARLKVLPDSNAENSTHGPITRSSRGSFGDYGEDSLQEMLPAPGIIKSTRVREDRESHTAHARADQTLVEVTTEARAANRPKRKRAAAVIRNKTQIIRQAGVLIAVLGETLAYTQRPGANEPPPELWKHLLLDNPANRELIAELVAELKKLNAWLASDQRGKEKEKIMAGLRKVGVKILKTYGTTVAVGAGLLTVGAICTLLQTVGLEAVVENAKIWKGFK